MLQKYTKNNPIWLKINLKSFQTSTNQMRKKKIRKSHFFGMTPFQGMPLSQKKCKSQTAMLKFCLWNITTNINFSQPGGVNVILQTVRQIDATQNKAVPDDPYARLFKAAPSC